MTDVRISQVPVQVIIRDSDPDVRLTQIPVQVVASHSVPGVRMYQAPVQVLVSNPGPETRMYQAPVQVLFNQPRIGFNEDAGNEPVYQGDPDTGLSYISGTWDYTVLLGSDPQTAVYYTSGTVTFTNGDATIYLDDGYANDDVIIIIQQGDVIGAFNGIISSMPVTTV